MGKKEQGPTHSQIIGIVWLSAALLIISAVAFFSSSHGKQRPLTDSTEAVERAILTTQEDSIYRARWQNKHNTHITRKQNRIDSTFYTHTPPTPTKQPLMVELNSADTLTLQLLHGIGPAYAHRIVRYRERLGGFVSVDQLLEVYGFTPELLTHIRPSLRLDTDDLRRIPVNTIELKQLAKHPYIEYYQARDIIRLRSLGTRFHSPDDLRAVPSMADSTLQRILPYLDFSDSIPTNYSRAQ